MLERLVQASKADLARLVEENAESAKLLIEKESASLHQRVTSLEKQIDERFKAQKVVETVVVKTVLESNVESGH